MSSLQHALFSEWLLRPPTDWPEAPPQNSHKHGGQASLAPSSTQRGSLKLTPEPRKELKDQDTGCLRSTSYLVNLD